MPGLLPVMMLNLSASAPKMCIRDSAMGADYRVLSESTADVYERLNVSKLAAALAKEGCELVSVKERDESLESFYISIVGGGAHHV